MTAVTLIFPHQLFSNHPSIVRGQDVYLIEECLFFKHYRFHQQKLVLHRASMKKYAQLLDRLNVKVNYIDSQNDLSDVRKLIHHLAQQNITGIQFADVADNWLKTRIKSCCNKHNIKITETVSPNFLNTLDGVKPFFDKKKTYFQTAFYIDQRKQREILVDAGGHPLGGQWTFDADNRLKYPKNDKPPAVTVAKDDSCVREAKAYVARYFPNNYASAENFIYPTDHAAASIWLDEFLETRFEKFGRYEDAMVANEHYLHHSVLTPMLNIGLLSPQQIIDKALQIADDKNIPLNSLEGFIRQIMGWREFIRIVYEREGVNQRTKNFWGFERKIPESFWLATTGIFPVDNVIKKLLQTGYSHHIERLMVIGNFMLLCEFHPDDVYRWFMEMYVDGYDWVMVPNVYGMSQFADGGLMTTKPYISGSHYLLKMSDYQKGAWTEIWDGLFWRFMHMHRDFFLKNPRLGMLVKTFDKMPEEKRKKHLEVAENYLNQLDER
ncbi:cryptochrome/photolyase family protein [Methylicorpusculum sp.]|uniref:cryptochrome/photolyase family protein n=2 Tax=Methylicorpusculum sp. TaxID=2713644 RepID=UPI002730DFDD|nr:cryptochrome/photolyase family protein [Methylicorpusculum sp.]MDP2178207.1 cryptochrome/photolyase family protein [Methylicorpusculum sp.]MDP3530522.1 cryptochrome/photolyase family protein [Methylicorpusculum sp.]